MKVSLEKKDGKDIVFVKKRQYRMWFVQKHNKTSLENFKIFVDGKRMDGDDTWIPPKIFGPAIEGAREFFSKIRKERKNRR